MELTAAFNSHELVDTIRNNMLEFMKKNLCWSDGHKFTRFIAGID